MADDLKRCKKCGKDKPTLSFSVDRSARDGLQYQCKACFKRWRDENIDRVKAAHRDHYERNKETYIRRARVNAKSRMESDPLRERAIRRSIEERYRARSPERALANAKRWKAKNTEVVRAHNASTKKRCVDQLRDSYVRSRLGIAKADDDLLLIEAKRQQLTIHRLLKQMKKAIDEGDSK